jgi:hypothetical protein
MTLFRTAVLGRTPTTYRVLKLGTNLVALWAYGGARHSPSPLLTPSILYRFRISCELPLIRYNHGANLWFARILLTPLPYTVDLPSE